MTSFNPSPPASPPGSEPSPTATADPPWFDRIAWPLFGAAAVVAAILLLWFTRDRTLSADELAWFMHSPEPGLGTALEPHVGHLILTTRLVYEAIFSTLGVGYLPFRLLMIGTVILTAGLFFAYAGRRVGKLAALAPTLVLLVFGTDWAHFLSGNGFTVIGALACGVGALVALDRDDRTGDLIAAALLSLGVVTYSVALPFLLGAAVLIALREDRWRRAWVVAIPVVIYVGWWLWALRYDYSSDTEIALDNALLFPSWAFQSLSAVLGSLTGFDFDFTYGSKATIAAGPTLAVLALVGIGWRLRRGSVPKALWAAMAIALGLWLMGAVTKGLLRTPDSTRYLYPGAIMVLIALAAAAAGLRWRRWGYIALFIVAAAGVSTNVAELRDSSASQRFSATQERAALAGIEIAGPNANRSYVPDVGPLEVTLAFGPGDDTGTYLDAVDRYGSIGYSPEQVRGLAGPLRAGTDESLVRALGLAVSPAAEQLPRRGCVDLGPDPSATPSLELAPGQTLALESDRGATVKVGRFGDAPSVDAGTLKPGEVQTLAVPADEIPEPWHVTSSAPVRACVSGAQ